jgi:hypothetical protein
VVEEIPALFKQPVLFADHSARRRGAETNNNLGPNASQFRPKPRLAGNNFGIGWLFVDTPLAAFFELEMLHRIRDVDIRAINSSLFQCPAQQSACRTHEGMAGTIFLVAGLFADQDDASRGWTFPKYGLGRMAIQVAASARLRGVPQLIESGIGGNESFSTQNFESRHISPPVQTPQLILGIIQNAFAPLG